MKTWLRRGLSALGLMIGLPLLLGFGWWLLNLGDAEPQPWPQALELPRNQVPVDYNLLTLLVAAPEIQGGFLLGACDGDDCVKRWRERLPRLAELRAANPGFGAVCEGLAARAELRFEDTMPETMRIDWPLPAMSGPVSCHSWLLSRALEAAEAGNIQALLHWLRQADRLDRALLAGSRSLVAQSVSARLWGHKLQVLVAMATVHPALGQELAPLASLDAQTWLARQLDWVRVEASFQRGTAVSLRTNCCAPAGLPMSDFDRWHCRLSAPVAQLEYTTQLLSRRWLQVQLHLQQTRSLPDSLSTLRSLLGDADLVGRWQRIRHTVPHLLTDVAGPPYLVYFERHVDLQLAAEATRLWLLVPGQDLQTRASPALHKRLSRTADGPAGWQLAPHDAGNRGHLPLRWPTPS